MGPEPEFSHIYDVPSSQSSLGVLFLDRLTKIVVPTFAIFKSENEKRVCLTISNNENS